MLNFKNSMPKFKSAVFNFKSTVLNFKKYRHKADSSKISASGFPGRAVRKTFFTGLLVLLILAVAVFALAACEPAGQQTVHGADALAVHFIDVGQGDAILVQAPGAALLIDGGPGTAGQKVVDYLRKAGVSGIDLVISTHPHEDHIGGLISVLQSFPVGEVIDPAVVHTTKTFENYLTLIDEKDIIFTEGRAGMRRDLGGGAVLEILHPVSPSGQHLNNASIVARLTFGQTAFLFAGDAEEEAEAEILRRGAELKSCVLKVGHHGSRTSTGDDFLLAVDPDAAVIMCGADNSYGHPHEETLHNLAGAGVHVYRTDINGTIVVTADGRSCTVEAQR